MRSDTPFPRNAGRTFAIDQLLPTPKTHDPHSREANLQASLEAARDENGRLVQALSYTTIERAKMHEQRDEFLAALCLITVCDDLSQAVEVARAAVAIAAGNGQ